MTGCSAWGCYNRSERGFKLHVFPKDPSRRRIWEANAKRNIPTPDGELWKASSHSKLCEEHFDCSQFESKRSDGLKKLKCNAVPTVFAHCKAPRVKKQPRNRNSVNNTTMDTLSFVLEDHAYTRVPPPCPVFKVDDDVKPATTAEVNSTEEQSEIETGEVETTTAQKLSKLEAKMKRYRSKLHKVCKRKRTLLQQTTTRDKNLVGLSARESTTQCLIAKPYRYSLSALLFSPTESNNSKR